MVHGFLCLALPKPGDPGVVPVVRRFTHISLYTPKFWFWQDVQAKLSADGGLFLGPSHAIQVGSPLENILALYRTAGSLTENIDDAVLSIRDDKALDEINMSKLF